MRLDSSATNDMAEFFDEDSSLKRVPEDTIKKIQTVCREKNETELISANIRNILFCGASRSGKTTSFKVFMDPCYCPQSSTMFSETQNTTFKSFSLKNNQTGNVHEFILNLIDSPGTFEIRAADDEFETRSNEKIGELIVECLNHEVTYLNLVAMFLTISGRVGDRDVDSVDLFMRMFGGCEMPIILCITHADEYNDNKRTLIEKEVKLHPRLNKYFESNQLEILFMGCVDYIHKDFYDPREVAMKYKEVVGWRKSFLNRIFDAEKRVELHKTKIFGSRRDNVKEILKMCHSELSYLMKADPETAEYKRRLDSNVPNMEYLYKNKMLLDDDPEVDKKLVEAFWDLIQTIKKSALDKMKKMQLIAPWSLE